jgi:predicted nucleic acid-binding protein
MRSLTRLTNPGALLLADASTIINLNASGCAQEVIKALPNRLAVVDIVPAELELGRTRGRRDADLLDDLIKGGLIERVELGEGAEGYFEQLVVGPAALTLDDGEAATIAYAVEHGGIAIIDERKANRICAQRFPTLQVASTTDIFMHPDVARAIARESLAQGVMNALQLARMRVLPHHVEWVLGLIGSEQAALCPSLPRAVRHADGRLSKQEV